MLRSKLLKKYDTRFYPYAFDVLNIIALGRTAKEVQEELSILDKKTRDNLEKVYNDRLDFLQDTFVTCFKLNISNNQMLPYVFKKVQDKYGVNYAKEFNQKICKYNYLFR